MLLLGLRFCLFFFLLKRWFWTLLAEIISSLANQSKQCKTSSPSSENTDYSGWKPFCCTDWWIRTIRTTIEYENLYYSTTINSGTPNYASARGRHMEGEKHTRNNPRTHGHTHEPIHSPTLQKYSSTWYITAVKHSSTQRKNPHPPTSTNPRTHPPCV